MIINPYAFGSSFDPDAEAFFAAVLANGGTISAGTKSAVNNFVLSAKANSYWSKLQRINLFCGDQLAACLVPLKIGAGSSTETNNNFVSGDYSESTGLTGNGTSKYLSTGFPLNTNGINDGHISVYNSGGSGWWTGSFDTNADRNALFFATTDIRYDYVGDAGGFGLISVPGTVTGFFTGSRTASNDARLFKNGVQIGTSALNGAVVTSNVMEIFRVVQLLYHSGSIRAYSIGTGLSPTEAASYNTDMEAFQDALGRGVQ